MDETPLEKCPRCFAELREPWQFCPSCGLPLDPALSSDSEIDSPNISYVKRPAAAPALRHPSRRESLLRSGLHLLVLLAFIGIVTGGLLVLSPNLLARLLASTGPIVPDPIDPRRNVPLDSLVAVPVDEMEWAWVKPGEIRTGDPETWRDLKPSQIVWTPPDPFWISAYEITNFQYFEFLVDTLRDSFEDDGPEGRQPASWGREGPTIRWLDTDYTGLNPKPAFEQMELPVRSVTFIEAQRFAKWLGQRLNARVRLPFWYEWEKAARGEKGFVYPWGNEFDRRRCIINARGPGPGIQMGGKNPEGEEDLRDVSPYGVYNMAGNVSEWVDTLAGLTKLTKFTMGGDFASNHESYARTWERTAYPPSFRAQFVGFRVLKEAEAE